ncbi:MAG: butyrate kinase [Candidatus Shapirobacteria bacterium]|nr:butyrate kinase [Candidatus Shapirobacteria bacterium]
MKILVINPGSTTTKLAVFNDKNLIFEYKIDHAQDSSFQQKFSKPGNIFNQFEHRAQNIEKILKENQIDKLDAVVGRGGMIPSITSGTYLITDKLLNTLKNKPLANHASNLGAPLAKKIATDFKISNKAFIVDPVTTDEILDRHKITGISEIHRYAGWHALNQKAVSREYATSIGKKYEDLNLIVAHFGGGASFGAHKHGKTINVINAIPGEGPFTPERSGYLPSQQLIELCFSGKFTQEELLHKVLGGGGLFSLLNTKSVVDLRENYNHLPPKTKDIVDEMITGFARYICTIIPDFEGEKIDQIIITGGIAHWPLISERIKRDLNQVNIGITTIPGEKELEALRDGALRVLNNEEQAKKYK